MTKKRHVKKNDELTKKSKNKKRKTKKYKKIKNFYLRMFLITMDFIVRISFKLIKMVFKGVKNTFKHFVSMIKSKSETDEITNENKVFANRCIIITTSIILLSVLFVVKEQSMFYAYPLVSCIVPFLKHSEGINNDPYNEYKDLSLYNKIIKINISILIVFFICLGSKIWIINPCMILIFITPLILGNLNKESQWKLYE